MNDSSTVAVGSCLSISKPLSIGLRPVPICLRGRRMRCLMIEPEVELAASEAQSTYRRLILILHAKSSWQHPTLRAMPCGPEKHLKSCKSRCMGHNRGWEEAASMFAGASIELKPCNDALLEAPGKSWEEV
ncbi:Detected protein of unknown function [Hibiscus syriacus]|uniref:Uncharacterized protein n=1 Tax=Hibiscus syriacus TaxID=106335 RepID=A0A6A2WKA6_HIBSY|nr:Detected protein of unknown function [Hibiscus syriacus]